MVADAVRARYDEIARDLARGKPQPILDVDERNGELQLAAKWPPAERITLWPKRPPNAPARLPTPSLTLNGPPNTRELWLTGVGEPFVAVFRSERSDGRALLSLPGGGYEFLSIENEGLNVAATFTPMGITVFVLVYRLPGEGWAEPQDVPLQDGQRAMRLIRRDAGRLGITRPSSGSSVSPQAACSPRRWRPRDATPSTRG